VTFPPPPTAVPTNNSWQPTPPPNETNTYTYTGVITTTIVRPPVIVSPIPSGEPTPPLPSPNPTVSAQFVATSAISTSVTSNQTFAVTGQTGLAQFANAEVDTGTVGIPNLVNTTSNTYYNYVRNSNPTLTDVFDVGSVANLEAGTPDQTVFTTVYGSGNGLLDIIPEPSATGQHVPVGPSNNASITTTEKDADGQLTTRKVGADGSYVETVSYPDGTSATATVNSNGTALYTFPLGGAPTNSTVQVGAPVGGQIPVQIVYAPFALGQPNQQTVNVQVPNWYPQGTPSLYNQTYINQGPTVLPNPFPSPNPETAGACNLGNDIHGHLLKQIQLKPYSNKLVQTTTKLDPLFGEIETITSNVWNTEGIGLTCSDTTDVVNQFYDYSGQSFFVPWYQSTPLQISTIDFQLGLTQAVINNQSYRFGKGAAQTRSARTARVGTSAQTRGAGRAQTAPPQGWPQLLARAMTQEVQTRLERQRLMRHAAHWRQLKALRMKGIL
jgi:hypothetical protein